MESRDTIGGGTRTAELTLPGFLHDVCSAIHPFGFASPFFRTLPLAKHGLEWIHPPACLAHPFDHSAPALLYRSLALTCAALGPDAHAYERLFTPFVQNAEKLLPEVLGPPIHVPRHPWLMMRFGIQSLRSATACINKHFQDKTARALFAGMAGHSNMPLEARPTAAFGLMLGTLAHVGGWPFVKGGSQKLADALASYFISLGGRVVTGTHVKSLKELPTSKAVVFDLSPRQILQLMFDQLPPSYRWELRKFRHGPGVFKVDWALSSPIPWKMQQCLKAATVHVGGSAEEIAESEHIVANGRCPEKPFVLLAQQSLFDDSRAPQGQHTAWGYCHVPANSKIDMTERMELQIERFAPGFRDCILARHTMTAMDFEKYNPNYVGGDITGGSQNLLQVVARPSLRVSPYTMPVKGVFICSASTPPGGGVHGMCGYHAARAVLSTILYNR